MSPGGDSLGRRRIEIGQSQSRGLQTGGDHGEKALHDLWFWEQILDGNLETNAGAGTGGLVLPTLCVAGPVGGAAGIYQVTIAWRGTATISNNVNNPCGAASGNYGNANEFRRIIQVPTFLDPNT